MIRHILLFSLDKNSSSEARRDMLEGLKKFPSQFSQIQNWEMGINVSNRDDTYDYGMTMTFADHESLISYLTSEEHEGFVRDTFRPVVTKRAIVTFEIPASTSND